MNGNGSKSFIRGESYWVKLDPTRGNEIRKSRHCLVVSANAMNQNLPRALVTPITSKGQALGCRPTTEFNKKPPRNLFDQIRSVDRSRLVKRMEKIDESIWHPILLEMLT